MKISISSGSATLTDASGIISDEALTFDECQWLAHQMWLLSQTTLPERCVAAADKMWNTFSALNNDTSAIILYTKD
jgi:hypothetical protein